MNATSDTTRKKRGWCRKETLEKERWLARGGDGGRSKRAVFFISPPSRPLVGRWVVERGLPRLLSVSRTSGLYRVPFSSFLSFSSRIRSLSLSFLVALSRSHCQPLSRAFSLWSLSLTSVLFRARLSQPFYFAISFPRQRSFFLPLPTYMLAFFPLSLRRSRLVANLAPVSPPFTHARFSGFSYAPFRPPAYPLRNRSTETCSGVAGTNENATEGNGVAYEIRAI